MSSLTRLSTVRDADLIIVLEHGEIIEQELTKSSLPWAKILSALHSAIELD